MHTHTATTHYFTGSPLLTIHADGYIEANDIPTGNRILLAEIEASDIQNAIRCYIWNVELTDESKLWFKNLEEAMASRLSPKSEIDALSES